MLHVYNFTCFSSRAIHLEAVQSMTTSEFIEVFIRFSNSICVPTSVYSDNAKSFVQVGNIIEQLFTSSGFEEKFRLASISHRTIAVYAVWYGVVWKNESRLLSTVYSRSLVGLPLLTLNLSLSFLTFRKSRITDP